jgi:hypothetical protein
MTRRAVVTLAAVALGAGVFVSSVATATGPCSKKLCSEEIAAGCAGLKGMDLSACTKAVLFNCNNTDCSCTDPTLPACGPTTTTSSSTTTSTTSTTTPTSSTTTSSTTTTSTTMIDRCCVASSCLRLNPPGCFAAGGVPIGDGTCEPNPCPPATTTTTIPACTFLLKWGVPSGTGNGELSFPEGVATDGSGNVYVADTYNSRIQKFDASGTFLIMWGSFGSGNGQFNIPFGVATDGSGTVYVADYGNDRIQKFACP